MRNIKILLWFFLAVNVFSQELEEDYWKDYRYSSSGRHLNNFQFCREQFLNGKKLYESKNYADAIPCFKRSLAEFSTEICYYYYGLALFDTRDYENAIKAFNKTIQGFQERNYGYLLYNRGFLDLQYMAVSLASSSNEYTIFKQDYTYDDNENCREYYFAYYNIACAHALLNNREAAVQYIIKAIEHGYPYLDYIFNDPDVSMVFNSVNGDEIKNTIQEVYAKGFGLSLADGKEYEYRIFEDYEKYQFYNTTVKYLYFSGGWQSTSREYSGTYMIRNYTILIELNRQLSGRQLYDLPVKFGIQIENMHEKRRWTVITNQWRRDTQ
ncbi:MAG: tetratricopeptide repeat protein [Treponema sp.]|jgi:tetratricopeptide (TPR) repeat protein|nr:tetratricopeptide repeat protein [Treponema sp.]